MYIFFPVIVIGSVGFFLGLGLSLAAKKFHVSKDPRISQIHEVLPDFNCGSCGYINCSEFAEAVAKGNAKSNGCIPGGPKAAHAIADILGVTAQTLEPMMAVVHCKGGKKEASERSIYDGIVDCHAAAISGNGSKVCLDGCLGLGTCAKSCSFNAIKINENGVAIIDPELCTGCGNCVDVCPRGLISLIPIVHRIFLACSNHDRGVRVKKYCSVGCTACTLCIKTTSSGAISMEHSLPVLDYTKNENFIPAAYKCPSDCFVDLVRVRPKANIDTKCDGCGKCVPDCPVPNAVTGEPSKRHVIDKEKCIGCGICLDKCHVHAISLWGGLGYTSGKKRIFNI